MTVPRVDLGILVEKPREKVTVPRVDPGILVSPGLSQIPQVHAWRPAFPTTREFPGYRANYLKEEHNYACLS